MQDATTSSDPPGLTLYKQGGEAWQLPSVSPACTQVEAYLRFVRVPFNVEICSSTGRTPTGQTPALEKGELVAGVDDAGPGPRSQTPGSSSGSVLAEFSAARDCIAFAKQHVHDLDEGLSSSQRAELLAYSVLIQTRLETATLVSGWCEPVGCAESRKVLGKAPFPLNYILPWTQQREVQRKFGRLDMAEVYSDALHAITALADRLRASGGRFFFGAQPSSLDALLIGHLVHYRRSPSVAPVLQNKVAGISVLTDYVEYVMKEFFGTSTLPTASPGPKEPSEWLWGPAWSEAAKGQTVTTAKEEPTPAAQQFQRYGRYWLMAAGTALVAYALGSGRYVRVQGLVQTLMDDDDDDDEGDEGDE